jgi:uncharacterized cupredoxin-like copper-binding protein
MNSRAPFVVILSVGIALAGTACQRAAEQPTPPRADEGAQVVTVVAKEFAFEPKVINIKAGIAKFTVRNEGVVEHDFEIVGATGHGAEHEAKLIPPREAYEVEVNLKPGTYQIVCNVPGHKDAGMVATIAVI